MFTETTAGVAESVVPMHRARISGWFRAAFWRQAPLPSPLSVAGRRAGTGEVVAVLFDADNIAPTKAGAVLASAAGLGSLRIVRAYGDFFSTSLAGWRHAMIAHAISGRQVTTVTAGKDTADHAIVADAIRLAYTTDVSTVVIASSDSDFIDLAMQLREIGCTVHGYGERKTARAMVAACDRFVYLEDLSPRPSDTHGSGRAATAKTAAKATPPKSGHAAKTTAKAKPAPVKAAESSQASDDWAASVRELVATLSSGSKGAELPKVCLRMHAQGITARLPERGRAKPGRFLTTCGLFEVVTTKDPNGRSIHTYLRNKPTPADR
ncbi:NYN domain-containing protein [Nocardia yunnanensis]|uniref:NYN domain-containing protein n=1 Tax=Nocardia yunnanensis TaxID=2382165 RepID=A0A386ZCP4_9NOCA|nr:NYN domain-containing protein [Nocardia yunnanensis]AYF75276.1 NYN domain-containing protein [Nocardia yunnanensis]